MENLTIQELYTSEARGSDETGNGTAEKPFKTILQAMRHAGKEPFPTIYVDAKGEKPESPFEVAAKKQQKNQKKSEVW